MLYEEAGSNAKTFQGGLKRDCDEHGRLHPKRRAANGRGMRLADFVAHESARAADLSDVEVAAVRLYTSHDGGVPAAPAPADGGAPPRGAGQAARH